MALVLYYYRMIWPLPVYIALLSFRANDGLLDRAASVLVPCIFLDALLSVFYSYRAPTRPLTYCGPLTFAYLTMTAWWIKLQMIRTKTTMRMTTT